MKTKTITQRCFLPAKPLEVYMAFLNPKKHSEFTGSKATGSSRVGGRFTAWDGYITGKNLKLVNGKKIVQEWKTTDWTKKEPPSIVEFAFSRKKKGTELKMIHSGIPARLASRYKEGWVDAYWVPLKQYFEKKTERR